MTDSHVGRYFVTLRAGEIQRRGRLVALAESDHDLVRLVSWLDGISTTDEIASAKTIGYGDEHWRFFDTPYQAESFIAETDSRECEA